MRSLSEIFFSELQSGMTTLSVESFRAQYDFMKHQTNQDVSEFCKSCSKIEIKFI